MQYLQDNRGRRGLEEVLRQTEYLIARGKTDLPLTLCFAANRGDAMLMQKLLKRGYDPNEPDRNGRPPLVRKQTHSQSFLSPEP